jgi:hypothetical protein
MNQEPPFRTPKGETLVRRPLPDDHFCRLPGNFFYFLL